MKNGGLIGKRLRKTPAIARMVAGTGKKSRLNVLQKDAARTLIPGFNAFEPFYAIRNATLVGMVQTPPFTEKRLSFEKKLGNASRSNICLHYKRTDVR